MYLQLIEVSSAGKVGGFGNKLQCIQTHTHAVNRGAYSVEILAERFPLSKFDNMRSLCV